MYDDMRLRFHWQSNTSETVTRSFRRWNAEIIFQHSTMHKHIKKHQPGIFFYFTESDFNLKTVNSTSKNRSVPESNLLLVTKKINQKKNWNHSSKMHKKKINKCIVTLKCFKIKYHSNKMKNIDHTYILKKEVGSI